MWDPPRSEIKPVSSALAGGLFTTELPGKPMFFLIAERIVSHVQGKRNPSKTVGVARGHQRADRMKP